MKSHSSSEHSFLNSLFQIDYYSHLEVLFFFNRYVWKVYLSHWWESQLFPWIYMAPPYRFWLHNLLRSDSEKVRFFVVVFVFVSNFIVSIKKFKWKEVKLSIFFTNQSGIIKIPISLQKFPFWTKVFYFFNWKLSILNFRRKNYKNCVKFG